MGMWARRFSVAPLLGMAAVILRGRMPALLGQAVEGFDACGGDETVEDVGVLATDIGGTATAVRLRLGGGGGR